MDCDGQTDSVFTSGWEGPAGCSRDQASDHHGLQTHHQDDRHPAQRHELWISVHCHQDHPNQDRLRPAGQDAGETCSLVIALFVLLIYKKQSLLTAFYYNIIPTTHMCVSVRSWLTTGQWGYHMTAQISGEYSCDLLTVIKSPHGGVSHYSFKCRKNTK